MDFSLPMIAAPFSGDDFDQPIDQTMVFSEGDAGVMTAQPLGPPHLTLAGMIVSLIALKYLTESNLVTGDVSEVKVSLLNILNITVQAIVGIMLLKLAAAKLLQNGIVVPGLNDFLGAV